MKKYLFIILSALSLTAVAQKKVAVLTPVCRDNSVSMFYQQIVRGSMESAVTSTDEYVSYDRTAFDKVLEEHAFERSGAVDDSQIRQMGVYAGVDYVLVTELSAAEGYMNIIVKILNIETGEFSKSLSELTEQQPKMVQSVCTDLAKQLFGIVDVTIGIRKGTLQLPEGRYEGEIKNGKPHGNGKIYYKKDNDLERLTYEGDWVNGVPSGEGIIVWTNGSKYTGGIHNGVRSGHGTTISPDGNRIEGTSVAGKWSGNVTIHFYDGSIYVGEMKDNAITGKGTVSFPNGDKYVGDLVDGKAHGWGIKYGKEGDRYEGPWKNDKREGKGTYYWSAGRLTGTWTNDVLSGYVRVYANDGSEEYGNFVNGQADGEWTMKTAAGKYLKGWYSKGTMTTKYH